MKNKIVSILLTACMLLSLLPAVAITASADTVQTHNHGTALPSAGGTLSGDYYLTGNVTLQDYITVESGKTLNLCLNGYVLKGTGSNKLIFNYGTLNIYDCENENAGAHNFTVQSDGLWQYTPTATNPTAYSDLTARPETGAVVSLTGGVITGGNTYNRKLHYGGAIYSTGTLNLYGGTICGNAALGFKTSSFGGGIYSTGTLNLYGGRVCGNFCTTDGGGIQVASNSTLTMADGVEVSFNTAGRDAGGIFVSGNFTLNGGVISFNSANKDSGNAGGIEIDECNAIINGGMISNNFAAKEGGGIKISNPYGTFTSKITGGVVITGNKAASGGGIFLDYITSLEISGDPVVVGNTLLNGTTANNLQQNDWDCMLYFGSSGLTTGACIGITSSSRFFDGKTMTKEQIAAVAEYFFTDDPSRAIAYQEMSSTVHKTEEELGYDCPGEDEPSVRDMMCDEKHFKNALFKGLTVSTGYSITYMLEGEAVTNMVGAPYAYNNTLGVSAAKLSSVVPTVPEGKIFRGWFDDATAGTKVTNIAIGVTGNKILYARLEDAPTLTTTTAGGFTSADGVTNKTPVVAFGATFAQYSTQTIEKYGFYIYNTDTSLDTATKADLSNAWSGDLTTAEGMFFANVENVAVADTYYAKAYVVIDGTYYFSDLMSAQGNETDWLVIG